MVDSVRRYTVNELADLLAEPPARIGYIIRKYRIKPVIIISGARLFSAQQVEDIKKGLYEMQVRR